MILTTANATDIILIGLRTRCISEILKPCIDLYNYCGEWGEQVQYYLIRVWYSIMSQTMACPYSMIIIARLICTNNDFCSTDSLARLIIGFKSTNDHFDHSLSIYHNPSQIHETSTVGIQNITPTEVTIYICNWIWQHYRVGSVIINGSTRYVTYHRSNYVWTRCLFDDEFVDRLMRCESK